MKLTKAQLLVLKYNYEFALMIMTPGICAGVVALTALFMYKP